MQKVSTRCVFSIFAALLCLRISEACPAIATWDHPNVVVFLSDDQGYGDFGFTGNRDVATPNIDGLARDGAFVQNFFVCPVCSPTRAEFLTGRYHARGGVFSTSAGGERLDLDETTIAEVFQNAGYSTAAFGKWHNGMQPPYHPNARGFDEYYGFCSGHWGHYFDPILEHNGALVRGSGYVVDDFTNRAIKFIEDRRNGPFFVYLPYNTPHSPMQVPDKYWERFADKEISQPASSSSKQQQDVDHTRAALAMCENIDDNVGRVLKRLDELGLAENTIVCYLCDNGPNGARYNAGLKGRKGSTDEGGVRSPLFVRWPPKVAGGSQVERISGAIDLLPTLSELCGIKPELNQPLDGESIASDLLGAKISRPDRMIFSHWNGRVSVRTDQYRLDHQGVLFDMIADPGQLQPVTDQPGTSHKLMSAVAEWKKEVLVELDRDPAPFPIGHPEFRFTQLPARDATSTGKIPRSNRYPNDSFFTNWVDPDDTISWPVEVLAAGKYRVQLYYTLRESDLGPTLELQMGDSRISRKIDIAHDPPLIGAAADRFERAESYVKDFRPIDLGVIELNRGPGQLVLRTTEMPGERSIDFRLLMFNRID